MQKHSPECPHCAAARELAIRLGHVCADHDPFVMISALETMMVSVLVACAPSINDAVNQSSESHESICNRLFAEEQKVGIPPRTTMPIPARVN